MLDSRTFVHLPRWARIVAVVFLLAAALFGAGLAYRLATADTPGQRDYSNIIIISMSLVQMALSALAVIWILLYSERDVNTDALNRRTEDFLGSHLPQVLKRVTPSYDLRATTTNVRLLGRTDIFGAGYELENGGEKMMLWVGINVSRLIVVYWISADDQMSAQRAQDVFRFTFGGATRVGFDVFYESAKTPGGENIVSIWATVKASENLLTVPAERLFWMQDIAMMTESFWRTAVRNRVRMSRAEPSPL